MTGRPLDIAVSKFFEPMSVTPLGYDETVGLVERAELRRQSTLAQISAARQSALGQYFTPVRAAKMMAEMLEVPEGPVVRILDPCAGTGILVTALAERIRHARPEVPIEIIAVEIDKDLRVPLSENLGELEELGGVKARFVNQDFLKWAQTSESKFDLVIQNPPYSKLRSDSEEQMKLRSTGIEVPNIYAAFLMLGIRLLKPGGQQVSVTPRSWMNGTYYTQFRTDLVAEAGIDRIHLFESRSKVFSDSGVLQEAVLVSATRGKWPEYVTVSNSVDHQQSSRRQIVRYSEVVTGDFIYVPSTKEDKEAVEWMSQYARYSLEDLGLQVSTGRVVEFRSRENLVGEKSPEALPFVRAGHIANGHAEHPAWLKKPEWFVLAPSASRSALVPPGTYVLVKRFSAKEESRRISAGIWVSSDWAAFDNKLNFIHCDGQGIETEIAIGLARFLNSTRTDEHFRVFSGHTQVNATDLRKMRFPSISQLRKVSKGVAQDQYSLDHLVETVLTEDADK